MHPLVRAGKLSLSVSGVKAGDQSDRDLVGRVPPLTMDFFQKPGHVLAERLHGSYSFCILFNSTWISANADIPVAGAYHKHLGVLE